MLSATAMGEPYDPDADSVYNSIRDQHVVNLLRQNYIVSGLPTERYVDRNSCDVKFQVSIRFNIWRNINDSHVDWFFGYTQQSIWAIYAKSSPFRGNIYNPSVQFYYPIIRGTRLSGALQGGFEHKSNGQDGDNSRSMNYFYATYAHYFGKCVSAQLKLLYGYGFVGSALSERIYDYYGYGHLALTYHTPNYRFEAMLKVAPLVRMKSADVEMGLYYRISKVHNDPYLYIQYTYGYGEIMSECVPGTHTHSMLRFGISIKPHALDIY